MKSIKLVHIAHNTTHSRINGQRNQCTLRLVRLIHSQYFSPVRVWYVKVGVSAITSGSLFKKKLS